MQVHDHQQRSLKYFNLFSPNTVFPNFQLIDCGLVPDASDNAMAQAVDMRQAVVGIHKEVPNNMRWVQTKAQLAYKNCAVFYVKRSNAQFRRRTHQLWTLKWIKRALDRSNADSWSQGRPDFFEWESKKHPTGNSKSTTSN